MNQTNAQNADAGTKDRSLYQVHYVTSGKKTHRFINIAAISAEHAMQQYRDLYPHYEATGLFMLTRIPLTIELMTGKEPK